jgi:hypothetical protein
MPDYTPYYKGEPISLPPLKLFTDFFYPVGCYFETTDTDFDPNTAWGGTWVLEDEGLVHVSSGTNYAVSNLGQDGGEATHTLTETEMPQHAHGIGWYENKGQASTGQKSANMVTQWWNVKSTPAGSGSGAGYPFWITNAGGNKAHNNMQPYKIVNRWHRTA